MIEAIKKDAQKRMDKSVDSLKSELVKVRAGRANPAILEHVMVSAYGTSTPLNQVASLGASDARTITVTPWDKNLVSEIEKAIMKADLGLNPTSAGQIIRVPLPPLTEERRKELVKQVKEEGENAKIAIRNIRRDANQALKDLVKDKSITEDEERGAQAKVQKLTDDAIKQVDLLVERKDSELMEV